jgi:hypothetical protein
MANMILAPNSNEIVDPLAKLTSTTWYYEYFEMHDLRLASRAVLEFAYIEAPTTEAKAYIFALIQMRKAIAACAGKAF